MRAATSKSANRGRPPLKSGEAKRASFNTRLRSALKEHLEESAREAGRSLSEEIESRLERSFDRTELLGGPEYEALFQMMTAAASVIETRLGQSPFSDPEASAVARNAWRQIIHNITSNPLEGEVVVEQLLIVKEMRNLSLPVFPSPKGLALSQSYDEWRRDQERYLKEVDQYEHQMIEYKSVLDIFSQKQLELADVANEAATTGLTLPRHR
jgi:Arc-like DNA binding domain